MAQLVELNKNADSFKNAGVEVIAVFREEAKGVEGLKAIKDKTKVPFTLGLDTPATRTKAYSVGKMKFDNYVVDKNGMITAIIDGNLRNRAKSEKLLEEIKKLTKREEKK